jgi:DNA mismatch endonuclease (patch repair protein)
MRRVKGRHTSPELVVRKALHAHGFRYRLHDKLLPGTPDLVFPRLRAVILVHGCFWHRHPGCRAASTPKTRTDFWEAKFKRNVERDHRDVEALERLGWRVLIIWECDTNGRAGDFLPATLAFLRGAGP